MTSTHKIAESSFVLIFFSAINLPGSLHWTQEPAILSLQNYCLQPTTNSQKPTAKQQQPTAKQPTSPSHSKHLFLFHFLLLDLHEFFIIIYYLFIYYIHDYIFSTYCMLYFRSFQLHCNLTCIYAVIYFVLFIKSNLFKLIF